MVTCQFFFLPNKNITFLLGFVVFFWITHTYNLMSASSEYELHLPLEKTMELFLKLHMSGLFHCAMFMVSNSFVYHFVRLFYVILLLSKVYEMSIVYSGESCRSILALQHHLVPKSCKFFSRSSSTR